MHFYHYYWVHYLIFTCWFQNISQIELLHFCQVVEWNPGLRTPALYGQFRLSRQKAHIFSLKLTRFIRTPVNTVKGHFFCLESQTLIYCQPHFTDTGYLHTVYFHYHNYVIIVDIVLCSNNDTFLRMNKILLQY